MYPVLVGHVVNDPFDGPEIIPENVIVSQASESVAPERRLSDPVLSSARERDWLTATGAVLVQLMVMVPVAVAVLTPPEASSAR